MSWPDVVTTIRGLFEAQLAARVTLLDPTVSTQVIYTEWETPVDTIRPTARINIQITAPEWDAEVAAHPAYMRTALVPIEIIFRYIAAPAKTALIAKVVGTYARAMAGVLDGIRPYSDANGGTVQNVPGRYRFRNQRLPGGTDQASINGFILNFTVQERGAV